MMARVEIGRNFAPRGRYHFSYFQESAVSEHVLYKEAFCVPTWLCVQDAKEAFLQVAPEFCPHVVRLPWVRALSLYDLQTHCYEHQTGFMIICSRDGMNYYFSDENDAIFFKLTFL